MMNEKIPEKTFDRKNRIRYTVILAAVLLISALLLRSVFSSPKLYSGVMTKLDEKKTTTMELTAAAAAASTAITMIPDDIGSPIADKIADTSSYFIIILCVLFVEKYVLTISGNVTFGVLLPLACGLGIAFLYTGKDFLKKIGIRLAILGLAFVTVVPVSVAVSGAVEKTYQSSIDQTLAEVENSTKEIENAAEEKQTEEKGFFANAWDKISGGAAGAVERVENLLSRFIEAAAVLLVTNCLIPILAVVLFVEIVKMVMNVRS